VPRPYGSTYNEVGRSGQGEGASIPFKQSSGVFGSFLATGPARGHDRRVRRRRRLDEWPMEENDQRVIHHAIRQP